MVERVVTIPREDLAVVFNAEKAAESGPVRGHGRLAGRTGPGLNRQATELRFLIFQLPH
ncbi:hypothetical protein [Amycolatopsis balhimycina]|uniref:hypothetical protein n=1 Tax=Amycolatopsis balhimycina TaxID=208443 RepID=UPI00035E53BA|nr:hypothetical protein [Amycolatopsis balhimycina]